MKTIEHWEDWKETCALALCSVETQQVLQGFAYARFKHYASAYARTTNVSDPAFLTPDAPEAWHCFETHFLIGKAPGAKSYKQWLFARLDAHGYSSQESVEAGATVLMRDVVREKLRRDYSSPRVISMGRPMGDAPGDEPPPTLQELLPSGMDTISDVERREFTKLAERDSVSAFGELDRRARIALLAHALGLSLAHPAVTRSAECGKSVLNTTFHHALVGVAAHVRSRHPREHASALAALTCLVWEHVQEKIFSWGKSENGCPQLCRIVET